MAIGTWREGAGKPKRRRPRRKKRKDPFENQPWFKMSQEDQEKFRDGINRSRSALDNLPGTYNSPVASTMDQWSAMMNKHRKQAKVK